MTACFHCGLPVPAGAAFGFAAAAGEWRGYCCAGCEAVSRAIGGLGLDDYYRLRAAPAAAPAEAAPADLAAYDAPAVQAKFVVPATDGSREATLLLEGLRCAACAWLVERVALRLPGVVSFEANYALRRARLRWDPHEAALSSILGAIGAVGYAAWPYDARRLALIERTERRSLLRRLWLAGLSMMQVMMYAVPVYLAGDGELTADATQLMRWAGLLLTLPVIGYSALPFFRGALRDARLRTLGVDVPVAIAIVVAFAASVAATLTGRGEVYFDSVTMFVFLLLGGRYLELLARSRAGESLQHLARVSPDGERARVGDIVVVRPGETVPADGVLESEAAVVSEAWLTGESAPIAKGCGEAVLGGSVNDGSAFTLRVTRVGARTALAAIERMMERALAERPRWVEAAQRASAWFVAAVLLAAVVAAAAWWQEDPERAVWVAVSVLIVTCPCAFALATPAALTVATGRLARGSLVVSRGHAIEALAVATDVIFDKTGTLTRGRPVLHGVRLLGSLDEPRCRAIAAAMARLSSHPLDRPLVEAGDVQGIRVQDHRAVAGAGLEARVDGAPMRLGRAQFVGATHAAAVPAADGIGGETTVWLGDEKGWLAAFVLRDALRPDARAAVDALRARGLSVHLLSGDAPEVALRVGRELGISHVTGGATPADKQRYVRELQSRGARVAMVGDGINDTPVLAQADVSIAMGGGADVAQLRSDAVLLSGRLPELVSAVDVARRTRAVVRQNIAWSLAYNAIAIPLAVAGLVTPLVAAIGMSASSLLVVANALRLRR